MLEKCTDIGKTITSPPLGPFPVKYVLVMIPAMDVMLRIVDPVKHFKVVQFDMF